MRPPQTPDDNGELHGAALCPEVGGMTSENAATVRLRSAFTHTSHLSAGGRLQHLITAPQHGPHRALARRAIIQVLRDAERHHRRVSFLVTFGDYTQHSVGDENGYEANWVLLHCRMAQNDPYAWLQRQISAAPNLTDLNAIIGVNISSWQQAPPSKVAG